MTETTFTITLAQLNPTVGDVAGNAAMARVARDKAKADGADLLVLPELFITGYPPEEVTPALWKRIIRRVRLRGSLRC